MSTENIRNFSIIAHIDHGKSTLADRIMLLTGAVTEREFHNQLLDSMDIEQERGITIKASAVKMDYIHEGKPYMLNLIDTPGHVDFHYEVSRALAACEGALLLVDATQGVQAQTVANAYLAIEGGLEIIPVINKVDLPAAQPDVVAEEIEHILGFKPHECVHVSAKTGMGVLAKSIAIEGSAHNVAAVAVCPGLVRTEYIGSDEADPLVLMAPGGRLTEPAEVASIALDLLDGDPCVASGAVVSLDSGFSP